MSSQETFTLPSTGQKIPAYGLGTWQSAPGEVATAVEHALKSGYRHIDGAWGYQNEAEVGEGIKKSGVPRSEIFITSKLFEHHHDPDMVPLALADTLKKLDTDYLDLYLMHWPAAIKPEHPPSKGLSKKWALNSKGKPDTDLKLSEDHVPTWRAMEKLVESGKVKNIGVSNFNIRRLRTLQKQAKIPIAANQVELSLQNPQFELVDWLKRHNVLAEAYSPLGSDGALLRNDEVVTKIAKSHGVDPANILLSWLVGRGVVVLPKSVTPSRIENNLKYVKLSSQEMEELSKRSSVIPQKRVCDQSEDFEWDIYEEKHPENNDKVQSQKD